jgi:hypothetical protein
MNEQQDIEFKSQLQRLQNEGIIKRIGPDRGGHWEIVE